MKWLMLVFFACIQFVYCHEREKRQINFGGSSSSSSSSSSSGSSRPSFQGSSSSGGSVSFGQSSQFSQKDVSLQKLFGNNQPPKQDSINTRFSFNSDSRRRLGANCRTPDGDSGTCRFITDRQCSPVLNRILSEGITRSLLNYLYAAIRQPCGFERFDFTLCCADGSGRPTTPRPTTTTRRTTTPRPVNERCGVNSRNKIIGGSLAPPGRWPWAVILGRAPSFNGIFEVQCGGTLLNEDTVLTAAHCVDRSVPRPPSHVRAGDTNIATSSDGDGVDVAIRSTIVHPQWNSRTLENDIAIIKLSRPLTYSRNIRWACLPDAYQGRNLTATLRNPDPAIIGWGSTRIGGGPENALRQAQVPLVSQQTCNSAYSSISATVKIGDKQFCAGNGVRDTCNGDSGGALLSDKLQGAWSVVGITSFGVDCAREDYPGVYTRVDRYLPWIRSNL